MIADITEFSTLSVNPDDVETEIPLFLKKDVYIGFSAIKLQLWIQLNQICKVALK